MHHYVTLENPPFRETFYIHAKVPREKLPQNNQNTDQGKKDLNKNKGTYKNTYPPQATISLPRPKANSVRFDDPYGDINHMEYTHKNTYFLDTQ